MGNTSKGSIYKRIKPSLVCVHAFSLTRFVCGSPNVTFGGSDWIMSTARPGLPCIFPDQVSGQDFSEEGGGGKRNMCSFTDVNKH